MRWRSGLRPRIPLGGGSSRRSPDPLVGWGFSRPRNFLVANVTRKSPTSYRLVTRKSGVSGVSPACYEEVMRKLTMSRGSYEELVPVEFGLY